ncbi:MAG: aspartate ammonia-lyase, partial [Thermoanaerobaculia bacterium]|nr:aspartate ammonia-lyase [Thermoanaerobaculia bacterium]
MAAGGVRVEEDLLGKVEVPAGALFGAQTRRAVENFPLRGERTIGSCPELVSALLAVKTAAAKANVRAGLLAPGVGEAIATAAGRVLAEGLFDEFPVHRLHGGGGTSANMNANEVLANLAEEILGGRRGEYRLVHPNDHVNLNQSTNDVYPTACHVALVTAFAPLSSSLAGLAASIRAKGAGLGRAPRLARTCLQDAVPSTWEALLGGWAGLVERGRERAAAQQA